MLRPVRVVDHRPGWGNGGGPDGGVSAWTRPSTIGWSGRRCSSQWSVLLQATLQAMQASPRPHSVRLSPSQWQVLEQSLDTLPSQAPPMPEFWQANRTANGRRLPLPMDFGPTEPMELPPQPNLAQVRQAVEAASLQFREALDGLHVRELDSQALFNHFFGPRPD